MKSRPHKKNISELYSNERGVALLIVLLVTALLIALIFEFSYASRISLNSAVSFRDNQRAYFLARSGITAFLKYGGQIRKIIPQGQWQSLPPLGDLDTMIEVMWIDQRSLININTISTSNWVENLLTSKGISTETVDKIKKLKQGPPSRNFVFLSELHEVMSDEEFYKVDEYLTADSDNKININTAPEDVLNSVLEGTTAGASAVTAIINARKENEINALADVGLNQNTVPSAVLNQLTADKVTSSNTAYRYYSKVRVGDYIKVVEAVVGPAGMTFWRTL